MKESSDALADARALPAESGRRLARLQQIDPYLIDISLRENPVGAGIGHTLENKLRILPQLRESGMRNIHLGSLDYALPDEPEVDDDFMAWLCDHEVDMRRCFAFTDIGAVLQTMIRLMRRDLRAGRRIAYDRPDELLALYARACATPQAPSL